MKTELLMTDLLSPKEHDEYVALMIIVRGGVQSIVESGKALTVIRDRRLYREQYRTFEDFCRAQFQMSRTYATRLINGFSTINSLADGDGELPSRERVVRELNKAPANRKQDAWDLAKKLSGNGKPTSTHVKKAVLEFIPDGRKQRINIEIIERLRTVNRLLGMDTDLSHATPDVMSQVTESLTKAESLLRCIKAMCFHSNGNGNGHSRIDDH